MASGGQESRGVLLGYIDEKIEESVASHIDFTTSKIGGVPDWICDQAPGLSCGICNSGLKLVCQIYAPLEGSVYHRTLYILACLQPPCWNKLESWKCIRGQKIESKSLSSTTSNQVVTQSVKTTDWLEDADNWDEVSDEQKDDNGNLQQDFVESSFHQMSIDQNDKRQMSSSSSDDLSPSQDDPNANLPESSGAMGGPDYSCSIAIGEVEAETDDELKDLVSAESPTLMPENRTNIPELFTGNPKVGSEITSKCLVSYYLYVEEEDCQDKSGYALTDHERQLLHQYTLKEGGLPDDARGQQGSGGGTDVYEKSMPRHGDLWFHKFVSVVQRNPGQVIRYCRDRARTPLFMSQPEPGIPKMCAYCQGPVLCEVQVLPSLIPSLECAGVGFTPLEFGSVFVYTCLNSCWGDNSIYRQEQIYLQAESM